MLFTELAYLAIPANWNDSNYFRLLRDTVCPQLSQCKWRVTPFKSLQVNGVTCL